MQRYDRVIICTSVYASMHSRVLFSHRTLGLGFMRPLRGVDLSEGVSTPTVTAALCRGKGSSALGGECYV